MKLDIDQLTVPGVNPFTRARLTAALEQELDRLVERHGLPFGREAVDIDIGRASFQVPPQASAGEMGVQIARQLFAGLHREATGRAPADLRRADVKHMTEPRE